MLDGAIMGDRKDSAASEMPFPSDSCTCALMLQRAQPQMISSMRWLIWLELEPKLAEKHRQCGVCDTKLCSSVCAWPVPILNVVTHLSCVMLLKPDKQTVHFFQGWHTTPTDSSAQGVY